MFFLTPIFFRYFLFVEGGLIDHAHHATYGQKAFDETVEFSKAIQKAINMTNSEDTLIVVTSDHAHTMSFSGYPIRGNDILGIAGTAKDHLPYATITYANGPGYRKEEDGHRYDLKDGDMSKYCRKCSENKYVNSVTFQATKTSNFPQLLLFHLRPTEATTWASSPQVHGLTSSPVPTSKT